MNKDPHQSTILITGGAGFVGSSFALHWKGRYPESEVIAFDNLKRRGSELNLARLKQAGVRFVHGDVRNASDVMRIDRIDALVECSAEPSVLAGYGAEARYVVDTNLLGTVNCLDLVSRDKADLLFLSTSRVYPISTINGNCVAGAHGFELDADPQVPGIGPVGIAEELPLAGVRSLYGATKLASELLITEYADANGLRAVIDRCGVIAGPWQMGKTDQGFVLLWIARHHWGLPLSYTGFGGTGAQVRDVLHIDDLCDLMTLQLERMDQVKGNTFNVGGGVANSATLAGFTEHAQRVTGKSIAIGSDPGERKGDLKVYITDNSRVTKATGWAPKRDLHAVFDDSYSWLKQHEDQLRAILA